MSDHRTSGFTLIELSIVLVIIGFIVGGVLVGQTLIHAAEIRSVLTEKERFATAANTFRGKYGCLPGNCINAVQLGFSGGDGRGDGIIYTYGNDEAQYWFWQHLFEAGLISNKVTRISGWVLAGDATPTCGICRRTTVTAYGAPYFQIGGWQVVDLEAIPSWDCSSYTPKPPLPAPRYRALLLANGNMQGVYDYRATVKLADGQAIDIKIDDGKPYSGNVVALSAYMFSDPACSGDNVLPALNPADGGGTDIPNNAYLNTTND